MRWTGKYVYSIFCAYFSIILFVHQAVQQEINGAGGNETALPSNYADENEILLKRFSEISAIT